MRLHDVQVILSGTNTADKIQAVNQQQGQVAQSQNAIQLGNQTQVKLTQAQLTEHKTGSKSIAEKEKRGRNSKQSAKNSSRLKVNPPLEDESNKLPINPSGNIIDIKV